IVAIFRDRFNYTMNYATANINIKKDYLYSPINMDLYSMKDEYENAKYNLLPFGKEFTDEDISKFDLSPGLDGFTRLSSGSIGSILMGTVNGQNNNLITLKLSESPRLEPDTDYIYTMDIATPNQEFTQDQFQPVHYHWYDDASQSAALTNEFLGFEKIDDMFYRVAFKVKTVKEFKTDDPYFRPFLYNSSEYLKTGTVVYVKNISLIKSDTPNENYIGNLGLLTKEELIQPKLSITSNGYLVDIKYFFITDQLLKDKGYTGIDSEESLCKKKQYRIDESNWIDYTDNTKILVNKV